MAAAQPSELSRNSKQVCYFDSMMPMTEYVRRQVSLPREIRDRLDMGTGGVA